MNPFLNAVQEGYSPEDVLKFLAKAIPKFSKPIRQASSMGYNAKQIVGFLSKTMAPRDLRGKSESEIHELNRMEDSQRVKNGLTMAATAVATPLAASAAQGALRRALPSSLQQLGNISPQPPPTGSVPPTGPSPVPQQTSQPPTPSNILPTSQQPPVNQVAPNIAQVTQPVQPKEKTSPSDELWSFVNKDRLSHRDPEVGAFLKVANNLKKYKGLNTKEKFDEFYKIFESKRQMGMSVPELARELFASYDDMLSKGSENAAQQQPQLQEKTGLSESEEQPQTQKPIAKSEIVASPHGLGEVKEIRNGQAIIDVDGKLHKVKEDELEASPLPEKELDELYDDLLRGIESETGEDVSRMVQWAGYNPENNTLQFLPHTGKLYKYSNISPEDASLLRDILSVRKTSGENFIGVWKAGSKSPIGAALSKLIRKLQAERGGKGNEYEETHEPIYSAYEPAVQAKKKKKKK